MFWWGGGTKYFHQVTNLLNVFSICYMHTPSESSPSVNVDVLLSQSEGYLFINVDPKGGISKSTSYGCY